MSQSVFHSIRLCMVNSRPEGTICPAPQKPSCLSAPTLPSTWRISPLKMQLPEASSDRPALACPLLLCAPPVRGPAEHGHCPHPSTLPGLYTCLPPAWELGGQGQCLSLSLYRAREHPKRLCLSSTWPGLCSFAGTPFCPSHKMLSATLPLSILPSRA